MAPDQEAHRVLHQRTQAGRGSSTAMRRHRRRVLETPWRTTPTPHGPTRLRRSQVPQMIVPGSNPRDQSTVAGRQPAEGRLLRSTSTGRRRRGRSIAPWTRPRLQWPLPGRPDWSSSQGRTCPRSLNKGAGVLPLQARLAETSKSLRQAKDGTSTHQCSVGGRKQGGRHEPQLPVETCSATAEGQRHFWQELLRARPASRGSKDIGQLGHAQDRPSPADMGPALSSASTGKYGGHKACVL